MRFDKGIREKLRVDASLKFWEREVTAEVTKATLGSSPTGSALAALGIGISPDDTQAVADRLVSSGFREFLNRAPGIEPYFRHREISIDRYLQEVITNANAHEEQIAHELLGGKRPTCVLSMSQASFTYRGARSVLIITTDEGKFLYKPHSMRYRAIFDELCEKLLPGRAHVPHVIDCGDACLCEFVESVPPANDQERCAYYEGLGGYLALAYFLSLTDQHVENILPVGPKFAPIDVETLLLASPAIGGAAPEPNDPALRIRNSIASTGMLSYGHDRLIGSLIAGSRCKNITTIHTSTEAIDHLDVVAKGFTETFRRCLRHKQMICDAIRSLANMDLRILMGPGSFYQGLQARFFELEGWDEDSRLRDLHDALSSTRFKRANQAVFEHERAVLVEHDIPYFTLKAGGPDLMAEGEVIWKDYLAESLTDTAIRRVETADEDALEWQLRLLRKLIEGMPLMSKTRVPDVRPQSEPLSEEEALAESGWVLRRIFDEQVDCGKGMHAIMAYGYADGGYGPLDASLGWGYAGVGVFAAACERLGAGDAKQARELVNLCLEEIARYGRYLGKAPEALSTAEVLGLKTGLAGLLRALQLMWATTHDPQVRKTYTDLLTLLDTLDVSGISDPAVLDALNELAKILAHTVPGLPKGDRNDWERPDSTEEPTSNDAPLPLQNRDDFHGGNAGAVEKLIVAGQHNQAGTYLAAMVARRHETGNYIHKGAWRVPYFDPTFFHGAAGIGYELLRYIRPDVVEPLFVQEQEPTR